jgi:hypothetical protein
VRLAEERGDKISRYGTNDGGFIPGWLSEI